MCHQASFHLKFARKYPLLALKLPKNLVVFKTESSEKKGKKRRYGIIPDTNYTGLSHPILGMGAGAHGIGNISVFLTKIGKFDIVLMYYVSIARLIPIIKLL